MNKFNLIALACLGIALSGAFFLLGNSVNAVELSSPRYLQIAWEVHESFRADQDYFNCWDYSNALVKELEAEGYRAFVKKGLKCDSYCWRPDFNALNCCEPHAWVAVETENGLIEVETTTGRIIWK